MSALSKLLIPAVLSPAHAFPTRAIKSEVRVSPEFVKLLSIGLLLASGLWAGDALRLMKRKLPQRNGAATAKKPRLAITGTADESIQID